MPQLATHNKPATTRITDRYHRAQALLQAYFGTQPIALNTDISPHWIAGTQCFWYQKNWHIDNRSDGSRPHAIGSEYRLVDAAAQSNTLAFDHQALASALSAAAVQPVSAEQLPITDVSLRLSPTRVNFSAFGQDWEYRAADQQCRPHEHAHKDSNRSPDGRLQAFLRDHNLWLRDCETGSERALTQDGERFYEYANAPAVTGKREIEIVDVLWSPDSQRLVTQLIDTRKVALGVPLIQHVPEQGVRPTLQDAGRRVAMLGDKHVDAWQLLSIDIATGAIQTLQHRPLPINYPPYLGYFIAGRAWWNQDNRRVHFIDQDTLRTNTAVHTWDTYTGASTCLLAEDPNTKSLLGDTDKNRVMATPLVGSDELVWLSERSGWAHLYLYDLNSGALKQTLTQGEWLVRDIIDVDEQARELWIKTAGRDQTHNPYHTDICRINLDSGELTPLTHSDHEYTAQGLKSHLPLYQTQSSVSPDHQYIVTTRTRVDEVPVSLLLDRDGNSLMTVATADTQRLPKDWRWPEITQTTAADGHADIYGLLFKPSDFCPDKTYPVLDFSTLLMSEPVGAFGGGLYLEAAAYAELGFIVVKFFNRALAGFRSKAFHDHKDHSLPFYNLADNVAAIKQLAESHPYMNLDRVGVTLHSSYPSALTGLLIYPDFYTVGVSYNAMSDARLMPLEDELGGRDFPPHEQFAAQLKGKLLLIAGMLDYAVPVSSTFRMVEALQRANKAFDMLILPNLGHDFSGYAKRRQWDYLVRHLQGVTPPEDFCLRLE